jgi:hypothetical protein
MREDYLTIVQAGHPIGREREAYYMLGRNGKPLVIEVKRHFSGRLPVYVRIHGQDQWHALNVATTDYPDPGDYHIGLLLDRSNLAKLVFKPVSGGSEIQFNLGKLNFELIAREQV